MYMPGVVCYSMCMVPGSDPDDPIAAAALQWMSRRLAGGWTIQDDAALHAWCAADPHHAAAFAEVEEGFALAGDAFAASPVERIPLHRGWLAAALVLVAISIGGAGWLASTISPASASSVQVEVVHTTPVGTTRTVTLPDGSTVDLDADTLLRWHGDHGDRRLTLERGRAVFSVVRDPARPFIVQSGVSQVQVLGTVFCVDRRLSSLVVSVAEGRVRVRHYTHATGTQILETELTAGRQAKAGDALTVGNAPVADFAAWRSGRLVFHDLPLAEVVAEVRRYDPRPLTVDPMVAGVHLTGTFPRDDRAGLLANLGEVMPVRVEMTADGGARIVPR